MKLSQHIRKITTDDNLSIDDRIDAVFALRQEQDCTDEKDVLENDVEYFNCLIDMILKENDTYAHDPELLQLYALLAETYVELGKYRQLKDVAHGVLNIIRYNTTKWEAMEQTLPRIIDAVSESVYNHSLYELHLLYIYSALHAGKLDSNFKGRVRKLLKLRILLNENDWLEHLFDKQMQKNIIQLLSTDELLKIILHPQIGHLKKDPVEYTWEWENIYYDVEDKLNERFANAPRHMGFCFHYWSAKQELLENEYHIKWCSPAQMNPRILFD